MMKRGHDGVGWPGIARTGVAPTPIGSIGSIGPVRLVVTIVILLASADVAAAQDQEQIEAALKAAFEGKRVVTRIDLPGTQEGVDLRIGAAQPIDYREYNGRLKNFGPALRAGDAATVTLVKMKKDLIEFQLSGGGFGTFGDDTNTTVYIPYVDKSDREKELERDVRDERDDHRRRELQRDLDEIREHRERENRRIDEERERASEVKRLEIADRRLHGGSRFNLRYPDDVPREIRPDDVIAALAEYVDFTPMGWPSDTAPPGTPGPLGPPRTSDDAPPSERHAARRSGASLRSPATGARSPRRQCHRHDIDVLARRGADYG